MCYYSSLRADLNVQISVLIGICKSCHLLFIDVSSETFQQVCCGEPHPLLAVLDALPSRRPERERSQPEPHGDQHIPNPLEVN